jgi:hypothetical protein
MLPNVSHPLDPLTTFCDVYQLLRKQTTWWADSAWLRFAAQAAALSPANAHDTVQRIRATADALSLTAPWYAALASPLRLVVGATLVQIGDTAEAFSAEVKAVRHLFRKAGLHLSGSPAIKAILAMRVISDSQPATAPAVERLRLIFAQLKRRHWWLTGGEHVTACAILSQCPLTPGELSVISDGIYHQLLEHDYPRGSSLWAAATILPALCLPAKQAASRFIALSEMVRARFTGPWMVDGDALAMLCFLDHHTERIITRLEEVIDVLRGLEPVQFAEVNVHVAADLVFLDLVRFDTNMRMITDMDEMGRVRALIRLQRALSLLLVQVPSTPVMVGGGTWPTPGL